MKPVLKVAVAFVIAQVALCAVLGLTTYLLSPKADFLTGAILYVYYPTVYGIWKIMYFAGESNMVMPIILGVPLGIIVYGIIFSVIFNYFKRNYS
jgi:hypothetical protein